ncbi:NAD(P)H-binding protein [Pseudomonas sp. dw_358]|uniref:NAD(P)H-binding protein n=1 Tax=Pseudomonas sp. dw_358 TaxID=2720083 RepID=UPI001BD67924|nr:NAD(P)H-binding protein [Pseudomonas sp. dw_358]
MIVVTGASGQLGQGIVSQLASRVGPAHIVASARDLHPLAPLQALGVQVRQGDFTVPESLPAVFAGAGQALLVSVNQLGETALCMHRTAITAARAAGVRRVLYTSHMGARADSPFLAAVDHAATEAMLAEAGACFTSLRHGFYAESGLHMIGRAFEIGELRVPEDGPVSWTTRADLAEADAILLSEEGRLDSITPALTAPEAFTMADLADIASRLTGREIRHVTLTDEQWLDEAVAQGRPAAIAGMLLGMYQAARRGDFATVDPALEGLLGRRPKTMRDVLAQVLGPSADAAPSSVAPH